MTDLERVSYEEAREWFWIRTALWFVPAYLTSAIGLFIVPTADMNSLKARLVVSLLSALGVTVLGLLAAAFSMQFPWMRLGRRRLWWLNAFACAVLAGFGAVGASAVVLTILRENPANIDGSFVIETAKTVMMAGIAGAAFWGMAFGAWFLLRSDKHFVESL